MLERIFEYSVFFHNTDFFAQFIPQKTLITKVLFKFWKNNPGPQADTASYHNILLFEAYIAILRSSFKNYFIWDLKNGICPLSTHLGNQKLFLEIMEYKKGITGVILFELEHSNTV